MISTSLTPTTGTKDFVNSYLNFCKYESALESSAFLAIGTEAIVARLYGVLSSGLSSVGIKDEDLHFFHLHMECDDEHAETLCDIMNDFKQSPSWFDRSWDAINHALNLRLEFFDHLYDIIQKNRLERSFQKFKRESLLQMLIWGKIIFITLQQVIKIQFIETQMKSTTLTSPSIVHLFLRKLLTLELWNS